MPRASLLKEETFIHLATRESLAEASTQPEKTNPPSESEKDGEESALKMRRVSAPPLMDSACGELNKAMNVKEFLHEDLEKMMTVQDFLLSEEQLELKHFFKETAIRPVLKKQQSAPLFKYKL